MTAPARRRTRLAGFAGLLGAVLAAGACATDDLATPSCEPGQRLGVVAQSVPGAAYLPCVETLPEGWSFGSFSSGDDGTRFTLRSDRADSPVEVELRADCEVGAATPVAPRAEGVRTYQQVAAVSPRYAGRFYDVFPGGCVVTTFDFARGPHIALVDELDGALGLYPRRQLRQELRDQLGVELDP